MKNIENFKLERWYSGGRELTKEELKPLGLEKECYYSLEDRAYQAAYDISNDWAKEEPEWDDVEEGFKKGAEEGIEYCKDKVEKFKKMIENDILLTDKDTKILLLTLIEEHLKF